MQPNRWTELFFLDEATALAAGHRPCTFCQRERSIEFRRHWVAANQPFFAISDIKVDAIDNILHEERTAVAKPFRQLDGLPDGVFVEFNEKPYLIFKEKIFEWSFGGYLEPVEKPSDVFVKILTPLSTVRAIQNGFQVKVF